MIGTHATRVQYPGAIVFLHVLRSMVLALPQANAYLHELFMTLHGLRLSTVHSLTFLVLDTKPLEQWRKF